jgi:predicted nucleic acid-binding protein
MAGVLVVDSSILIDFLQQRTDAVSFVLPLQAGGVLAIHPIVYMEVLQGAANAKELRVIDRGLAAMKLVRVKGDDLAASIELFRRHHLSSSVGWPDCLIASTCVRLGVPLATLNEKHFRAFKGLKVVRPY